MSCPYVPSRMAKNATKENPAISTAGKNVELLELSLLVRMPKNIPTLENSLAVSCKVKNTPTYHIPL